jgi:hypothetical protein
MYITTCDLSHYYEEAKMDKNLKTQNNNLEEDNLEDGVLVLEKLENVLMDDDDHVEIPLISTSLVPMSRIPTTKIGASSSVPLPSASQFRPSSTPLPPRRGPCNSHDGVRRKE